MHPIPPHPLVSQTLKILKQPTHLGRNEGSNVKSMETLKSLTPCTVQQTTTPNILSEFAKRQRKSGNKNLSVDRIQCVKASFQRL